MSQFFLSQKPKPFISGKREKRNLVNPDIESIEQETLNDFVKLKNKMNEQSSLALNLLFTSVTIAILSGNLGFSLFSYGRLISAVQK